MSDDHAAEIDKRVRTYILVFVALAVLTVITVAVAYNIKLVNAANQCNAPIDLLGIRPWILVSADAARRAGLRCIAAVGDNKILEIPRSWKSPAPGHNRRPSPGASTPRDRQVTRCRATLSLHFKPSPFWEHAPSAGFHLQST